MTNPADIPELPPVTDLVTVEGEVEGWHPALVEEPQWWVADNPGDDSTRIRVVSHTELPTHAVTEDELVVSNKSLLQLIAQAPKTYTLHVEFDIDGQTYTDDLALVADDQGRAFLPAPGKWFVRAARPPQGAWRPADPELPA